MEPARFDLAHPPVSMARYHTSYFFTWHRLFVVSMLIVPSAISWKTTLSCGRSPPAPSHLYYYVIILNCTVYIFLIIVKMQRFEMMRWFFDNDCRPHLRKAAAFIVRVISTLCRTLLSVDPVRPLGDYAHARLRDIESYDADEEHQHSRCVELGVHTKKYKANGNIYRPSRNNLACIFRVEEYRFSLTGTLQPSMPCFASKTATIYYDDVEDLTGTITYNGNVGASVFSISILARGLEVARVEGTLDEPFLDDKHEIHGAGSWVST